MVSYILGLLVFSFSAFLLCAQGEDTRCGNWQPFKEEKCFIIIEQAGLKSYTDAVKVCQDNESTLVTIHFQEEQDFITEYLKTQKIADNVWIGIKYDNKVYKWNDNSDVVYENWAIGFPENKSDHCAQFESGDTNFGKWSEALCNKKNLVLCQRPQTWSLNHLQKVLLDTIKNPVPIGFIYTQLPNEKSPTEIWPWMIWKDITSVYAGVFFRAGGGQAGEFGRVQDENAPRLTEVDAVWTSDAAAWKEAYKHISPSSTNATLPVADRSKWMSTGSSTGNSRYASFITSGGEVRPRNMAVKIWKRMS